MGRCCFLDYSKAFDSVSHPKLQYKLLQYGFSDTLCKFMSAFLYNRRQCIRVNNAMSSFVDVNTVKNQKVLVLDPCFMIYILMTYVRL